MEWCEHRKGARRDLEMVRRGRAAVRVCWEIGRTRPKKATHQICLCGAAARSVRLQLCGAHPPGERVQFSSLYLLLTPPNLCSSARRRLAPRPATDLGFVEVRGVSQGERSAGVRIQKGHAPTMADNGRVGVTWAGWCLCSPRFRGRRGEEGEQKRLGDPRRVRAGRGRSSGRLGVVGRAEGGAG